MEDLDAITFRFEMRSIPVMQSALLVMSDQPDSVNELVGVDLTMMATDILGTLSEAEHDTYNRHEDTPMSPEGNPPQIEVDLDKAEAIALGHSLMAVRQSTEGTFVDLLISAMADFYPQIPDEWAAEAGEPLASVIQSTKESKND